MKCKQWFFTTFAEKTRIYISGKILYRSIDRNAGHARLCVVARLASAAVFRHR